MPDQLDPALAADGEGQRPELALPCGSSSCRSAGLAQWQAGSRQPASYVASQGTVLGRAGRVHVNLEDDQVSVGGDTHTIVRGSVASGSFALRGSSRAPSVAFLSGSRDVPGLRL